MKAQAVFGVFKVLASLVIFLSAGGNTGSVTRVDECEVTESLQTSIENILLQGQLSVSTISPPGCATVRFTRTASEEACSQALVEAEQLLKTQLRILQGLPDHIILSPGELPVQVSKLHGLISDLTTKLSELWTKETGGYLPYPVEHRLKCYNTSVLVRLGDIEQMRKRVEEDRAGRLEALLKPASLGEAESYFYTLNNNSFIKMTVDRLYGSDKYNLDLAGFTLHLLRTPTQRVEAYQRWLALATNAGQLVTEKILVLRKALHVEIAAAGPSAPPELVALQGLTEAYKNAVISNWGRAVGNNDLDAILAFASLPQEERTGDMFDELLPELIGKIYGTNNFLGVINFINELKWDLHKSTAFDKLLELVGSSTSGGDLGMVLAAKIKEAMDQLGSSSDLAKERFEIVTKKLPEVYQNIFWHNVCRIRLRDLYLFADFNGNPVNGQRYLYVWLQGGSREEGRFRFRPSISGDRVKFSIDNVYLNPGPQDEQYFDELKEGSTDLYRKRVSLRCGQTSPNWIIEPLALDSGSNEVRFKHEPLNGYLMASTNQDSNLRNVVVWTHPIIEPTDHVWTLQCD